MDVAVKLQDPELVRVIKWKTKKTRGHSYRLLSRKIVRQITSIDLHYRLLVSLPPVSSRVAAQVFSALLLVAAAVVVVCCRSSISDFLVYCWFMLASETPFKFLIYSLDFLVFSDMYRVSL